MSDTVSALSHAKFDGLAHIEETGLQGMITLRGDLASKPLKSAIKGAAGVTMPAVNSIKTNGDRGVCWMSPDEALILCPYGDVADVLSAMNQTLGTSHALIVNVSDARSVFRVTGPDARDVMAKLCPVDLSPAAFKPGMFRRTRMAQVPAAFWMPDAQTFQIICFRSVADYMFGVLRVAAQPNSPVTR